MTDHAFAPHHHELAAILDGRQTQFRRALASPPTFRDGANPGFTGWRAERVGKNLFQIIGGIGVGAEVSAPIAIGDRLWVQETWAKTRPRGAIFYSRGLSTPDFTEKLRQAYPNAILEINSRGNMPRHMSDLTLVVTDVRVQRLQEMSEADAIAEGVACKRLTESGFAFGRRIDARREHPCSAFRTLWNATYGPDAWDQNPWVGAVTFTVHNCNIDKMGEASNA